MWQGVQEGKAENILKRHAKMKVLLGGAGGGHLIKFLP